MQVKFLPIALFSNTAVTDESTPPERAKITLSSPNCSFNSATVDSIKEAQGIKNFINVKSNVLETLKFYLKEMGI